jgi:methyl-accepting chemotaxis protein
MNRAMSQVELVTQRNASAAEELAATVEEITASAESLRDLVAYFRVQEGGRGGVAAPELRRNRSSEEGGFAGAAFDRPVRNLA